MSRTKTPKDLATQQALTRIALLAAQILITLRQQSRGVSESEGVLRGWLQDDGVQFANSDLAPALAMLEAAGYIGRSAPRKNMSRKVSLATSPERAAEDAPADDVAPAVSEALAAPERASEAVGTAAQNGSKPVTGPSVAADGDALARAVLQALSPGNGRANRCPRDELPERLTSDGVQFDSDDLPEVLSRLHDVGQLQRVQRQPYSVHPQSLVLCGDHPYDETDGLAADICAAIKRRGERFEGDGQLHSWLTEDGVQFTAESLSAALRQLEHSDRIKRDVAEHSWSNQPVGGWYMAPHIYDER